MNSKGNLTVLHFHEMFDGIEIEIAAQNILIFDFQTFLLTFKLIFGFFRILFLVLFF